MIHVLLRYIGIKTKLLDHIKEEIQKITPENGYILDMFAGSTIVGQYLSDDFNVFSNDIQKYSFFVGKATLEINKNFDYKLLSYKKIEQSVYFKNNYEYLSGLLNKPLLYEKELFQKLQNNPDLSILLEFKNYYDNSPYCGHFNNAKVPKCFVNMDGIYSTEMYKKKFKDKGIYALFSLAYACPYFSLSQAIYVDSFRYALDKMKENKEIIDTEFYIYMNYLIYYLGNIVTSVGDHFAQPQQLKISEEKRLKREINKIITKKTLDKDILFNELEKQFKKIVYKSKDNKMFCEDYKRLFENEYSEYMKKVNTIYIDPPYTNAHYSRFYHILETLVKYDYPDIKYFGRYRTDRYQSPFCIRSEALKEFDEMINLCFSNKKNLVISYSDTSQCILSKDEIIKICKRYYANVNINQIDYLYRNFGQKPNKVKGNELLIVCKVI